MSPNFKFLAYRVVLCLERRCHQQNTVANISPQKVGLVTSLRESNVWSVTFNQTIIDR